MKNLSLYIFLLITFCTSLYGQEYAISYTYDSEQKTTKNSVSNQDFISYHKEVNKGFKNGIYWFKIEIKADHDFILQINNSRIVDANLYTDNLEISKTKRRKGITYKLSKKKATYYLKVITAKEAYIPITLDKVNEFEANTSRFLFINGAYYGFALMILIINIFYYINFKEVSILKYIFLIVSITLSIFFSDGLFSLFVTNTTFNSNIEPILHVAVAIFANIFTIDYLKAKNKIHLKAATSTSLLLLVALLSFFITKQFLFFVLIEILCLLSLGLNWIFGVKAYKTTKSAKIFVLGYTVILIAAFNFYLLRLLGLPLINNSITYLKFGGLIEMLLFTYTLVYDMKKLKEENTQMQEAITVYSDEIQLLSKPTEKADPLFNQKEKAILKLLKDQKSNLEIATELHISINTVKYHLKNIYKKLHIKGRKEITEYPF